MVPSSLISFSGKVAIVTGASSGIGRATSLLLSRLGAQLAITGRKEDNLTHIKEECEQNSKEKISPLTIVGDLSKEGDVERIIDTTVKNFGQIDILVNNAGIMEYGSIENTSLEQFDRLMNINVRSIYHMTMLAVPHLIRTTGTIVNVSSVNGLRSSDRYDEGFPGLLAYNVSKSAVDQLTKCVALELAKKGVRVNAVNPGVIETELQRRAGLNEEAYKQFLERCRETHALGRVGNVKEVASTIAFLASGAASYITGANVPVDGGRHAMCPR